MSDRPDTITEAAQIAYDTVMRRTAGDHDLAGIIRRGLHDAYRVGANRALEALAVQFDDIDQREFTAPGHWGPSDAADLTRACKFHDEAAER